MTRHAPNANEQLYTNISNARRLAISNTFRAFLRGEHIFINTSFQNTYYQRLANGYSFPHLSTIFPDTWDTLKERADLRTLIYKDARNIANVLLGHDGTQLREPVAEAAFTIQNTAYQERLQQIKIWHAFIMGTTMFVGYAGLLAAGICSWYILLPPLNDSALLIEGMEQQILTGLQNNTLSRLDQWLLERAIYDVQVAQGSDIFIIIGITFLVLCGFCTCWLLSIPIDNWRDKQDLQALNATVEALTTTTLQDVRTRQITLFAGSPTNDIANVEPTNLVNILLKLRLDEIGRNNSLNTQ